MSVIDSERRSHAADDADLPWCAQLDALLLQRWGAMRGVQAIIDEFQMMGFRPRAVYARIEYLLGPDTPLDPSARAEALLDGHAVRDSKTPGGWRLDGRPVRLVDVIVEANRVARALGNAEIFYPGVGV